MTQSEIHFRAPSIGASRIQATVAVPGHVAIHGNVIDVFTDGVNIACSPDVELPLGEQVPLEMAREDVPLSVSLRVIVRERQDVAGHRCYGLRFFSREELRQRLGEGLYAILNRRQAHRFTLDAPVSVTVSAADAAARVPARIVEVSAGGLGIVVERRFEMIFMSTDRLLIDAPLGRSDERGQGRPLALRIHNRLLTDEGRVRYGCGFEPASFAERRGARALVESLLEGESRVASPAVMH